MIFLTGKTGYGKTHAIQEYLKTKNIPIYIINDDKSYSNLLKQANVQIYSTKGWNKSLIKEIKKCESVIVIVDGMIQETKENMISVVYDIKEQIDPFLYNFSHADLITTVNHPYLMQQDDLHFILDKDYIQNRINKRIENPLLTNDIANLFYFQSPVDKQGNKEIGYQNMDFLASAQEMSEIWGVSSGHIKNLCANNEIVCKKISNTWLIDKRQGNPIYTLKKPIANKIN